MKGFLFFIGLFNKKYYIYIVMKNTDYKIVYTRGSGPGGQHKNKVETCVVITHLPTGLTERCQDTRSKIQNYNLAMTRLQNKIDNLKIEHEQAMKKALRDHMIKNPKVVRTYNYQRNEVKDHATGKKHNLKQFMEGQINL